MRVGRRRVYFLQLMKYTHDYLSEHRDVFLSLPGRFVSVTNTNPFDTEYGHSVNGIVQSVSTKLFSSPSDIVLKQRSIDKDPNTFQKKFRIEYKIIPLKQFMDRDYASINRLPLTITTFDGINEHTVGALTSRKIKVISDDGKRFPAEIGRLIYEYDDAVGTAGWEGYVPNHPINPLVKIHQPNKRKTKSLSVGCSRARQIEKIKAQKAALPR